MKLELNKDCIKFPFSQFMWVGFDWFSSMTCGGSGYNRGFCSRSELTQEWMDGWLGIKA